MILAGPQEVNSGKHADSVVARGQFFHCILVNRSCAHRGNCPRWPRVYQYAYKFPSAPKSATLKSQYPFRLGIFPGLLYVSGYERAQMKKKRLGEVLRERGHLSTADLNQILLHQRGKRIHLG